MSLAPGQKPGRRYQETAPYIVIEILSPDDTVSDLRDRIDDYLAVGVPNIWVVDPKSRALTVYQEREAHTFTERATTSDGAVSLDLADIFRRMAEDEAE
jgi:Uma2 family endonuclease